MECAPWDPSVQLKAGWVSEASPEEVTVAWMRAAWTFDTFATVMLTRMNGNGNADLSALVQEAH